MIVGRNTQEVRTARAPSKVTFFRGFRTDYIVSPDGERPSPQAYLVEQDAGFLLRPHFHQRHQFQVFIAGEGALGAHRLSPGTVHYASPESGYGPIVAGPSGLSYFTLRAVTDCTASPLPEERHRMRRGLKKQQYTLVAPEDGWSSRSASSPPAVEVRDIIAPDCQGLGAWFARLPVLASAQLGNANDGAGRFHIVLGGSMIVGDRIYEKDGVIFASSDETHFALRAGEHGADLLVLQFPRSALAS